MNSPYSIAETEIRAIIPADLDADELIANSWNNVTNATDRDTERHIREFKDTAIMYIDQGCSSF